MIEEGRIDNRVTLSTVLHNTDCILSLKLIMEVQKILDPMVRVIITSVGQHTRQDQPETEGIQEKSGETGDQALKRHCQIQRSNGPNFRINGQLNFI